MAKVTVGKKGAVYGVYYSTCNTETGKMERNLVYVDFSYKTTEHFIQGFRSNIRTRPKECNKKIQALRINLADLTAGMLAPCFSEKANETINFYMNKFETIQKGWNMELKEV